MSEEKKDSPFSVNIDFDESSRAWRRNKKYIGNGTFTYCCGIKKRTKSGYCRRDCANVQHRKKLMKTPGTMYYTSGLRKQVVGLPWQPCMTHRGMRI